MAEILPIRPWRYNRNLAERIDELTSPLFDVVSDKQRAALYQEPYNSIHLSVPQPPHPAERAQKLLQRWKEQGVILQDKLPAIYVYYQYFRLQGSAKEFCRKGFICHIRTYDWDEKVILRHENTIPKAVNDRTELLEKTQLHASATHGLYSDPTFELEKYMDEAIAFPVYETEDYQGVRDVLAVIHDKPVVDRFINLIEPKTIILADGHHRYEGSLSYKHSQQAKNPSHTGKEGYNYHLMYLTNTEADDLRILPTHRLISGMSSFHEADILKALEEDFIIKPIEDADTLNEVIVGKPWAFGLVFSERAYKVRLKPESLSKIKWHFPEVVKALDLTVMHYFIIEKALGIPGKEQRQSEHISFDRSFADCLQKVTQGTAQLAIITNEVSIEDVKRVCASGYTMPQKSTYFYPKVIGGFLFSSVQENEFATPIYYPF
ncbi:DUF1015 domain-containing protein [Ohtaekwangia sp.]|uniref:DUF1015 domain-containing protein n=1 Tax=Ohtaekwangia sp. TaxID=2066019 RepID=UPI002FDD11B6